MRLTACAVLSGLIGLLSVITGFTAPVFADGKRPSPGTRTTRPPAKSVLDAVLREAIRTAPDASDWPNHDYARLLDLGEVRVASDGTVRAIYRETYKLFNERARHLAEVHLPFNSSYQSVRVLSARTIRRDGTVVPVRPADIRLSAAVSDFPLYEDALYTSFSMPAIEDGCVIDYSYEMITRPLLLPGHFWTYWGFSGPEPVQLSRYTLHVPVEKPLRFKVYNDPDLKPVVRNAPDGRTRTYVWERRGLEPIKLEPAMPPLADVRVYMEVSSLGSWEEIGKWFWQLARPQIKPTDRIRATVARLIEGKNSGWEKAAALYDFVANRVRYVGLEFGLSAYRPYAASEVHDRLYGDCKDKTALLVTMLGLAGIEAHPALVRAGDPRPVEPALPTLNVFNHCIAVAQIEGKEIWLDPTAETCPLGDIPESIRGAQALVVGEEGARFRGIPVYTPEENRVEWDLQVRLQPDGGAQTEFTMSLRGAAAQALRATARSLQPDKRKEWMRALATQFAPGSQLKRFQLPDGTDKTDPFTLQLTIDSPAYARPVGSLLLVPVRLTPGQIERRNPFATQDARVWPIVETDNARTHIRSTFILPEGYRVEEVPEALKLSCEVQEFERTVARSEDGRTVIVTVVITERAGSVPPAGVEKVRTYYDHVLKAAEDQIVLKR